MEVVKIVDLRLRDFFSHTYIYVAKMPAYFH